MLYEIDAAAQVIQHFQYLTSTNISLHKNTYKYISADSITTKVTDNMLTAKCWVFYVRSELFYDGAFDVTHQS